MSAIPATFATPQGDDARARVRRELGIPDGAERVLVFVESSHWDTNWLRTSDEYFRDRLEPIFAAVLDALERDPRRIYCIESLFFLKLYWERRPEHRFALRRFLNNRQLRLMASSLTTPDTLLPHIEAVFRDFQLGQAWLRQHGFEHLRPTTAYFPDNFGHSPHVPSLMRALGIDRVAVTRIDGMYFVGSDWRPKSAFPLPGSTAALLEKEHATLDFVWRDDDGAEVLCHWNAFTYFHGDMLGHVGVVRWMGKLFGMPWRTCRHVARQLDAYVKDLLPLSRTPYLLCPIGMDFNDPIEDLGGLLARYNDVHYPRTGTYAVVAGFDDYFDLIDAHRRDLPTLEIDPNPYWTGFYATRPSLKQRPRRVVRSLLAAEKLAALSDDDGVHHALRDAWTHVALLNHHDAVTGTSPDRVFRAEQEPWMDRAEAALATATRDWPKEGPPADPCPPVGVRHEGDALVVETTHHRLTFSRSRGGCLTRFVHEGQDVLEGLGFDLVVYDDDGGLWRLGHEYAGGRFTVGARASDEPATLETVVHEDGALDVVITSVLRKQRFVRTLTVRDGEPFVRLRVAGHAPRRTTLTCRFEVQHDAASLAMDTLGGAITRPAERLYSPTFWPVPSRATLDGGDYALHVCFESTTAVSLQRPSGGGANVLEWIVARNAPKERAFRILPVLAHPAGGTSDEHQTHDAALFLAPGGACPRAVQRSIERTWLAPPLRARHDEADASFVLDDAEVTVVAAKRADSGKGLIVRLAAGASRGRTVRLHPRGRAVKMATLCDAREHDLEPLSVVSGSASVPLASRLVTVRLVLREGLFRTASR